MLHLFRHQTLLIVIMIILAAFGCTTQSAGDSSSSKPDSTITKTTVVPDSVKVGNDTTATGFTDTTAKTGTIKIAPNQERPVYSIENIKTETTAPANYYSQGILAYYCPHSMVQDNSCEVSVVISKLLSKDSAASKLANGVIKSSNHLTIQQVMADVKTDTVCIGSKMKVILNFSDSTSVKVLTPPTTVEQEMNQDSKQWLWQIVPKKAGPLTVVFQIFYWDGHDWVPASGKAFDINVNVNKMTYFASLENFIEQKPEWLITTIVIPIITFGVGIWRGKKTANS